MPESVNEGKLTAAWSKLIVRLVGVDKKIGNTAPGDALDSETVVNVPAPVAEKMGVEVKLFKIFGNKMLEPAAVTIKVVS